jgi:hypothetical protein
MTVKFEAHLGHCFKINNILNITKEFYQSLELVLIQSINSLILV